MTASVCMSIIGISKDTMCLIVLCSRKANHFADAASCSFPPRSRRTQPCWLPRFCIRQESTCLSVAQLCCFYIYVVARFCAARWIMTGSQSFSQDSSNNFYGKRSALRPGDYFRTICAYVAHEASFKSGSGYESRETTLCMLRYRRVR
jgi:hypothetical protein